jgi:hypothetical protein
MRDTRMGGGARWDGACSSFPPAAAGTSAVVLAVLYVSWYCTGAGPYSRVPSSLVHLEAPWREKRTKQNRRMERNNEWKHFAPSPPLCTSHLCKYRTVSSHLFSPSPRLHRSIAPPVYPARDQSPSEPNPPEEAKAMESAESVKPTGP